MATKIAAMGRKRRTGGEHVTPRTTIQIPVPWLELARLQARRNRQPVLWHILGKLAAEADEMGDPRPQLPWEDPQAK